MELSKRLQAVADLVSVGSIACDVGCDHGYIPVWLIQNRICPRVIAVDRGAGPLGNAKENVRAFGLEEYITLRLSDGVASLEKGEADSLILAGMGGRLIIKILSEGMEKIRAMKEVVLQPQSEIAAVRRFLRDSGFYIVQENMVYEDGKYYPMMRAVLPETREEENASGRVKETGRNVGFGVGTAGDRSREAAAEAEEIRREAYDRYGEYLLRHCHSVLYQFLLWEQEREHIIGREIFVSGKEKTEKCRQRAAALERSEKIRNYALSCFAE